VVPAWWVEGRQRQPLKSGIPVTVTQATTNNGFAGSLLHRALIVATRSLAPGLRARPPRPASAPGLRAPPKYFDTTAFLTASRFAIGNSSRNPIPGPAERDLEFWEHVHGKSGSAFRSVDFLLTRPFRGLGKKYSFLF
jgi:hypothetical protein